MMVNLYESTTVLPLEKAVKSQIICKHITDGFKLLIEKEPEVGSHFRRFANYVNSVIQYCLGSQEARGYGVEYYQATMVELDRKRRYAHDEMITSCSGINTACERNGLYPFCPGADHTREEYGDFAAMVTYALFSYETGRDPLGLDDLVAEYLRLRKMVPLDTRA